MVIYKTLTKSNYSDVGYRLVYEVIDLTLTKGLDNIAGTGNDIHRCFPSGGSRSDDYCLHQVSN